MLTRYQIYSSFILIFILFFSFLIPVVAKAGGGDEGAGNGIETSDGIGDEEDYATIRGVVDLSQWDFEEDGIINLHGEWEFYWEKLLEPGDFAKNPEKTGYIYVPGDWNGYQVDGEELPGHGYATYRLTLENLNEDEIKGIIMPELTSSYNLWIDDELLSVNGKVGTNPEESEPEYDIDVIVFNPESSTAQITMQISNFQHRRGGHNTGMEMGTADQIHAQHNSRTNTDLFLIGCLTILGLYNLGFFYYNRRDPVTLYFALFCLAIILYTLTASGGEMLITTYIPNFSWELQVAFEYISMALAVCLAFLFFYKLFPEDISLNFTRAVIVITGTYSAFVLISPVNIFSYTVVILQIIAIFPLIYITIALMKIAFIKKREGAALVISGFAVILFAVVYESMIYFYIIDSASILNFGFIIFIFTQSMLISTRFIRAYLSVESMSKQLKEYGDTLEEKVAKRTEKLGNILEKLRYAIVNETNIAISNLSGGSQELANISITAMDRATTMKDNLEEAGKDQLTVSERIAKGQDTIKELEDETSHTRQASESMETVSNDLVEILEGIQKLNYEIKGIAKHVNLLAINAGIEAAKAGEEGQSFAVVAEEIKKLSEQTYSFVDNIERQTIMSGEKLTELQESVDSVKSGFYRTEETVDTTNEVYKEVINSIEELTNNLNQVIEKVNEVASDSENISAISQEQAATTQEINAQISTLVELVESLEEE